MLRPRPRREIKFPISHDGCYEFAPKLPAKNQNLFFAAPNATGHYVRKVTGKKETITLAISTGVFDFRELSFRLSGKRKTFEVEAPGRYTTQLISGRLIVKFTTLVSLKAGEAIVVRGC